MKYKKQTNKKKKTQEYWRDSYRYISMVSYMPCRGLRTPQKVCPWYYPKLRNASSSWHLGGLNTLLLPLHIGSALPDAVVQVSVSSKGQIDKFKMIRFRKKTVCKKEKKNL